MMRHTNCLLATLLATLFAGASQGDTLIFQKVVNPNTSAMKFDIDQFDLDLIFGDDFFSPTNPVILFDDLVVSPSDVGTTYDSTAANDPNNFPAAAIQITDGLDEFIKVSMRESQVGGQGEDRGGMESMFFGQPTPPGPPDLVGATISRVSLTLDEFIFSTDSDPAFDVFITLSIFEIPEPVSAQLLLCGLMVVGIVPLRRRKL